MKSQFPTYQSLVDAKVLLPNEVIKHKVTHQKTLHPLSSEKSGVDENEILRVFFGNEIIQI